MKKNRPRGLLRGLAPVAKGEGDGGDPFPETGTLGIRRTMMERSKLRRESVTVSTPFGEVRGKRGWREGLETFAPEYEDCARLARENGVALREVYEAARRGQRP